MRTFRGRAAITLITVALLLTGLYASVRVKATDRAGGWQYTVVTFSSGLSASDMQQRLNQQGQEGWEVAATGTSTDGAHIWVFFKRPR